MSVEIITKDDLLTFKNDLINQMRDLMGSLPVKTRKWIRTPEVMELLGISEMTLQTLRSRKKIPFSKLGGVIYYNIDELDNLLDALKKA